MYLLLQKVTSPRFTILNGLRPGQSVKYNDLCVLDTATMTWQARAVSGDAPCVPGLPATGAKGGRAAPSATSRSLPRVDQGRDRPLDPR